MNFFGHAVAAGWVSPSPAFALGAMLPDLADMMASTSVVDDPVVARGVHFHHLTDRCFHQGATFKAMEADARRRLNELGVRKGTRWGVAHVGLELILDHLLFQSAARRDAYFAALRFGTSLGDIDARVAGFCRTLLDRTERLSPDTPEQLTDRLARIFALRPALRIQEPDTRKVTEWAKGAFPEVESRFEAWIAELEACVQRAYRAEMDPPSPMAEMASGPGTPSRGRGAS